MDPKSHHTTPVGNAMHTTPRSSTKGTLLLFLIRVKDSNHHHRGRRSIFIFQSMGILWQLGWFDSLFDPLSLNLLNSLHVYRRPNPRAFNHRCHRRPMSTNRVTRTYKILVYEWMVLGLAPLPASVSAVMVGRLFVEICEREERREKRGEASMGFQGSKTG